MCEKYLWAFLFCQLSLTIRVKKIEPSRRKKKKGGGERRGKKKKEDNKGPSICWREASLIRCFWSSNLLHAWGRSSCCGCFIHKVYLSLNRSIQHSALCRKLFYITAFQSVVFIRTTVNKQAPRWVTSKSISCIPSWFVYLKWRQKNASA